MRLSILVIYLCLAALYESWAIPLSVMLVIPLGVIGALLAASLRGLFNDIYFQVGLLTTIGLSAKNAILIVEFAVDAEKKGASRLRRGDGSGAPAAAAHPDDLHRLHRRRHAAGAGHMARAPAARTTSAPAWSAACSPPPCWRSSSCRCSSSWSTRGCSTTSSLDKHRGPNRWWNLSHPTPEELSGHRQG